MAIWLGFGVVFMVPRSWFEGFRVNVPPGPVRFRGCVDARPDRPIGRAGATGSVAARAHRGAGVGDGVDPPRDARRRGPGRAGPGGPALPGPGRGRSRRDPR